MRELRGLRGRKMEKREIRNSKFEIRNSIFQLLAGFLPVFGLVTWWDALRWHVQPSFWDRSLTTYGGLTLVPLAAWPERLADWAQLLGYIFASPLLNALLLIGLPVLLWTAMRHHAASTTHHAPRTTHHGSRITHHGSRITDHASRITDHASRITISCSPPTSSPTSSSTSPSASGSGIATSCRWCRCSASCWPASFVAGYSKLEARNTHHVSRNTQHAIRITHLPLHPSSGHWHTGPRPHSSSLARGHQPTPRRRRPRGVSGH